MAASDSRCCPLQGGTDRNNFGNDSRNENEYKEDEFIIMKRGIISFKIELIVDSKIRHESPAFSDPKNPIYINLINNNKSDKDSTRFKENYELEENDQEEATLFQ